MANILKYAESYINAKVTAYNNTSYEDLSKKRDKIRNLFFNIWSKCTYDRSLIKPGSGLERILDETLYEAHSKTDEDPVTFRKIQETVSEVLFASRLGVKSEKIDSTHESYFLLSRAKKRLGVFKPVDSIKPEEDLYGAAEARDAHLAEVASCVVDRHMGTHVVPHTQLLTIASQTGSFQFFVSGGVDLMSQLKGGDLWDTNIDQLKTTLDISSNRTLKFSNFEEYALCDLVIGNNDGHFKNAFIKFRYSKNAWDLIAIDNGNSFPWCHKDELPAKRTKPLHWFKWRALPHAQAPFSPRLVNKITFLNVDRLVEAIRPHLAASKKLEGKLTTLRDRIHRIKTLARERFSIFTIAERILKLPH